MSRRICDTDPDGLARTAWTGDPCPPRTCIFPACAGEPTVRTAEATASHNRHPRPCAEDPRLSVRHAPTKPWMLGTGPSMTLRRRRSEKPSQAVRRRESALAGRLDDRVVLDRADHAAAAAEQLVGVAHDQPVRAGLWSQRKQPLEHRGLVADGA